MEFKRLRERARAILRDNESTDIPLEIERGEVDVERLLEELHIYHTELVMQNEALVEGEKVTQRALARFNRLYQGLPFPTFVINAKGGIRDANGAAHALLALDQLTTPEYRSTLQEALEEATRDGAAERREITLRGAAGQDVVADIRLFRIPDTYDESSELVCSVLDQTGNVHQRHALEDMNRRLREERERYRILAQFSPEWDYWMGEEGRFVYVSPACARVTGYAPQDFLDDADLMLQIIHPDDREAYDRHLHGGSDDARALLHFRIITRSGEIRWIEHDCRAVWDTWGHYRGHRGTNRDITDRKQTEERGERLAYAVEQSPGVVVITDTDGVIEYVNERFCHITGFSREDVVGQCPGMLRYGEKNSEKYLQLWDTIRNGGIWEGEFNNRKRSGEPYWERARISPIRDARGEVTHYIKLAEDISDKRALTERLEYLAFHDPLTGLPNRGVMLDRIGQAVAQCRRAQQVLAVAFIDVDDFKVVNDSLGHSLGDQLLIQISNRLRFLLREGDTVARFGGDEFILLLSRLDHVEAVIPVIEKLQGALGQPMSLSGQQVHVTVSIGIAMYPGDSDSPEELVRHADAAMYQAKAEGRRCYHFYTAEMDAALQARMELDQAMRHALERKEFYLVYQPRVELVSGRLLSLEALVRWQHPQWGTVSPGRFIPLAEETGFILALGPEILRQACAQIRAWKDQGIATVPVAVNLSAREFREPDVVERILGVLTEAGLETGDLEIEVTESAAMNCVEQTTHTLARLNAHGVRISIDDFGTAYSSLNYLKRLPVHAIKIDQSFVSDMEEDPANHPEDAAIIRAIIRLGGTLGMQVIAEGIENRVQRDFLLDHGCSQGQGYLFSCPLPAADLEPLLARSATFDPDDGPPQ